MKEDIKLNQHRLQPTGHGHGYGQPDPREKANANNANCRARGAGGKGVRGVEREGVSERYDKLII